MPQDSRSPAVPDWMAGVVAAALAAVVLIATEPGLSIVWDEGYTLGRLARVRLWVAALRDPTGTAAGWRPPVIESIQDNRPAPSPDQFDTRAELFSAPMLAWFWPFAREEPHGHPPFYALAALVGDVLTPWRLPLSRARLGTMLAISLAAGAVLAATRRRWGTIPATAAAAALVLQPRLFAEAHYATYDAILTALWVGAILAFAAATDGTGRRPRWGWVVALGILGGWAADTKLTGWFLPIPFAAWIAGRAIAGRGRADESIRGIKALGVALPIAAATLYVFNPPWWPDPLGGVVRFFESNLGRAESINIPCLFLGQIYETPRQSLPPYNTLVWLVFVTPAGFLALGAIGTARGLGRLFRKDAEPNASASAGRLGSLAAVHLAFLLALRSLPHTPGHDGVRQFLAAFGCMAVLVAPGVSWVLERSRRWGRLAASAAVVEGVLSVALMLPVPLSYYSPLVGGLPGAARLGMEPTYYWDGLTAEAREWLNRHTPPGHSLLFATNPTSWFYLRETRQLRAAIAPFEPGEGRWYIVQNRPGALQPVERTLIEQQGPRHVIASKWGVPLVWAFPFEDYRRAALAAARQPL